MNVRTPYSNSDHLFGSGLVGQLSEIIHKTTEVVCEIKSTLILELKTSGISECFAFNQRQR